MIYRRPNDDSSAMNKLNSGRFELLNIDRGQLVLDPWPRTVRLMTFEPDANLVQKGLADEKNFKDRLTGLNNSFEPVPFESA